MRAYGRGPFDMTIQSLPLSDLPVSTSSAGWSPCTHDQLRFWISWSRFSNRPINSSCFRVEWHFPLDLGLFQRAIEQLVQSSDSLRLIFQKSASGLAQRADDTITAELSIADFATSLAPWDAALEWLDRASAQPFDLGKRCFTTALVRYGEDRWIWQLNQHHIISDYLSNAILLERLGKIYAQLAQNGYCTDTNHPSFLASVETLRDDERPPVAVTPQENGFDICPALNRGRKKRDGGIAEMDRVSFTLDDIWTARARSALDLPPTGHNALFHKRLFTPFLTGLVTLAARLSGTVDGVIGIPLHNRYRPGTETISGLFMHVVPTLFQFDESATLRDLRQQIGDTARATLKNNRDRRETGQPDYRILFNYLSLDLPDFAGHPSTEVVQANSPGFAGLDLSLRVRSSGKNSTIRITFDVNAALTQVLSANDIATAFRRLLDATVFTPDVPFRKVSLTDSTGRERAIAQTNAARAVPPPPYVSLLEGFSAQAAKTPSALALFDPNSRLSYAQLDNRSAAVARALCARGIGHGDRVIVALPRSTGMMVALLGVMRSGAAFCVLDTLLPLQRQSEVLSACAPALVISDSGGLPPEFLPPDMGVADLTTLITDGVSASASLPHIQPNWPMYVMFTSGSTGVPKGIIVPHGSFARYLYWAHGLAGRDQPWTWALTSTAAFEGAYRVFVSLICGGAVAVYPPTDLSDATSLLDALAADEVDFVSLTPSHLRVLVQRKWQISRLRAIVVLGEAFPSDLARRAREALGPGVSIQNWYGPTETVMATTMHVYAPQQDIQDLLPVGHAAPDSTIHILDAGLNPLPPGVPGEIFIGGNRLSLGYMKRPDLNSNAFLSDPFCPDGLLYKTGDIGWIDPQGKVTWLARKDSRIKINGRQFDLVEVEAALRQHPEVQDCAAVMRDDDWESLAFAYVADHPLLLSDLRAVAARSLPRAATPSAFFRVPRLPLNRNGKIDRRALRQLLNASAGLSAAEVPHATTPFSATEQRLEHIWCAVLGVSKVDRFSSFFDLGGDSLQILRMILSVEEDYAIRISPEDYDQVTTLSSLAALIDAKTAAAPFPEAPEKTRQISEIMKLFSISGINWAGERLGAALPVQGFNLAGNLPPLFWCFNGGHEPVAMARHLGEDQPLYALRSMNGLVTDAMDKARLLSDVSDLYANEIIRLHNHGPLIIGGNCQAGRIAEAVARRLLGMGKPVAGLCLLEYTPHQPYPGHLALFYGAESRDYNPFLKVADPQIVWKNLHKSVVWDIVPGDHGQYFSPPNTAPFTQKLRERMAEALAR